MKQKHNDKLVPGTNITIKEFKELAFKKFKAYPLMRMNYQKNQFEILNTFYKNVSITSDKLVSFCKKLGVKHELGYTGWSYSKAIIIKLK